MENVRNKPFNVAYTRRKLYVENKEKLWFVCQILSLQTNCIIKCAKNGKIKVFLSSQAFIAPLSSTYRKSCNNIFHFDFINDNLIYDWLHSTESNFCHSQATTTSNEKSCVLLCLKINLLISFDRVVCCDINIH